jgi:hypothetical protein
LSTWSAGARCRAGCRAALEAAWAARAWAARRPTWWPRAVTPERTQDLVLRTSRIAPSATGNACRAGTRGLGRSESARESAAATGAQSDAGAAAHVTTAEVRA